MLTYITTYCDNPEFLEQALDTMQSCTDERLKMIVVDDCSDVSPAELISARNDSRIQLFRIEDNIGFNSHGARNLAMHETTTEWNLMVDIDFKVNNIQNIIDLIADGELEATTPHFFAVMFAPEVNQDRPYPSVNDFLITKTAFWKAGGYDPEFYGWHHGDRALMHRMIGHDVKANSVVFGSSLTALRSPFAVTQIDPELTGNQERYSRDRSVFYVSEESQTLLMQQEAAAITRHANKTPIEYLPFTWEKII